MNVNDVISRMPDFRQLKIENRATEILVNEILTANSETIDAMGARITHLEAELAEARKLITQLQTALTDARYGLANYKLIDAGEYMQILLGADLAIDAAREKG